MPDGVDRRFAECMGIEVSLYHEDRLLESRLHRAVPLAQVDLLRRSVPFARDVFDQFIYSVTQYSIVEGTWDTFVGESLRYLAFTSDEPANSVPPLIPPGDRRHGRRHHVQISPPSTRRTGHRRAFDDNRSSAAAR